MERPIPVGGSEVGGRIRTLHLWAEEPSHPITISIYCPIHLNHHLVVSIEIMMMMTMMVTMMMMMTMTITMVMMMAMMMMIQVFWMPHLFSLSLSLC